VCPVRARADLQVVLFTTREVRIPVTRDLGRHVPPKISVLHRTLD
jgi:hypothetical protein